MSTATVSTESGNAGVDFLDTAARFPARPALWLDGEHYDYRAIATCVSQLARALHRLDGNLCAILGERSLTAYCAPLACLLAGKTFVPLGIHFPVARMAAMLSRSGAGLLIAGPGTDDVLADLLVAASAPLAVLRPEHADAAAGALPGPHRAVADGKFKRGEERALEAPLATTAPAYLLFTSGSTGQPKGVAVGHLALRAYVAAIRARFPELDEHQRCSQFFEPTFDLALHDLFVTWSSGACLYSVPANELMLPIDFANRHRLTVWFSVPSMVATLQRYRLLRADALSHLTLALFCGEALPGPLAAAWADAAPGARTENLYGPTEATIACTAHTVIRGGDTVDVVPIGCPLAGMEVAVLDEHDAPVATGVVGELHLGGVQLADGYWQDLALTQDRFPALTVAGRTATRWYRSGDLAMIDAAGVLHYRGRVDRQVKLRGYRVELQEIEAKLRAVCDTNEVAVVPLPVAAGTALQGVAAFVVGSTLDVAAVIGACRTSLPAYMVPAQVHLLDSMPLNANGKTDHHRLTALLAAPAARVSRRPAATVDTAQPADTANGS